MSCRCDDLWRSSWLTPTKIDPLKRVTRCKPWSNHCPLWRWAPHTRRQPVIKAEHTFAAVIVWAFSLGILAGPVAGYFIDRATAHQCKSHDWPKEKDQLHRDWCIGNGYQI
ncbi:hypothetical protein EBT31_14190 [bacterium]|nr:hypothetical protein [bacterium]NBX50826.1 hypothetical protein [bacterium]